MNRLTLFTCNHSDEAYGEIERLHTLFKSTFKRLMEPQLYWFDAGVAPNRFFGITVYLEDTAQGQADLNWLKGAVTQ